MLALVTRRSVLAAGVAVGAAVGTGGLVWLGRPATGYRVLDPGEIDIVEAIAAVLFPPGVFPVHGGDGGTAPLVDQILAEIVDPMAVAPFRYLLRAIELGTIAARGSSFSALPADEAAEVLDIWSSDDPFPRRMITDGYKAVLGMGFLRRREVLAHIGWRSECSH